MAGPRSPRPTPTRPRGGARTRLDVGDRFRNQDLLRAMLMASDNRAPTALGRAAGMTPDELVAAMNRIAKRPAPASSTKFTDPTGLHGNVSTAREMALALRTALEDDVLREIMGDRFEIVVAKGGYARSTTARRTSRSSRRSTT